MKPLSVYIVMGYKSDTVRLNHVGSIQLEESDLLISRIEANVAATAKPYILTYIISLYYTTISILIASQ